MGELTERVIEAIVENRARFEAFCASLSEEQLDRPVPQSTWIVRDFPAHLATLDPVMARMFASASSDAEMVGLAAEAPFDIDAFNDAAVAERRTWPLARVFAEAAPERARLIDVLRGISDAQAEKPMRFGGDAKRKAGVLPFKLFLAGWAQHDPIHVADMLRGLPELAEDGELRAWVENPFVAGYQRVMNSAGL